MSVFACLHGFWRRLTGSRKRAGTPEEEDARPLEEEVAQPVEAEAVTPSTVEPVKKAPPPGQRAKPGADDLTVIKGIGVASQTRLNVAGIWSYEDLARATSEEVHRALVGSRRGAQVDQWIERARQLSERSSSSTE